MKVILILLLLSASGYSLAQSACFSSFSDMTEFAPSRGRSVDTADINNDGNLDIVIGSYFNTSPSLYYLEGNGSGAFEDPVLIDAVFQLIGVETGDFNDDGNMDIIAVSRIQKTAYLYEGNGDGTFNTPISNSTQPVAFNSAPMGVSSGDLNSDGSLDFVTTNINGTCKVFLSNSFPNSTFSFTSSDLVSSGGNSRIEIDYINSDSFLDLVLVNNTTGSVTVQYGDGTGGFSPSPVFPTGSGCSNLTTNDIDNDGDVDIVTTNELNNDISLLLNDGTGSFAPIANFATDDKPIGVSVFDMNNDGNKDIQVVSSNDNVLNCFISDGSGGFINSINNPLSNTPLMIATGDFNGDSEIDMAITAELGEVMIVLLGNLTGIHEIPNTHATNANATAMCNNDFDGDDNLDIIVANSVNNEFYLYTGLGDGDFNPPVTFTGVTNPVKCVSDDFNGDSNADVAFIEKSTGQVRVFFGNGSGGFTSNTAFPCGAQPIDLKLGEFNNDGNIDFFVLNDGSTHTVLTGNGAGAFSAPITSFTFATAVSIEAGDLNGDGFDEIVTVDEATNNLAVFMNSTGSFGPPSPILLVGDSPRNLVLVDLDGDGNLDVVTTNYNDDNLSVMLGNGLGAFNSQPLIHSADPKPLDVVAADFNNDGHQDILVSFELGTGLTGLAHLYMGDGTGNLTLYKKFNLGVDPAEIQIGHFNNDTLMDAASLNVDSDNISILINTTAQISTPDGVEFCNGQSVNLVSNTDISNEWSNAETTQTIGATASGSYTVTTTQSPTGYCYSTSPEVTVSFLPPPAAPTITSTTTTACYGNTVELTSSAATGNIWSNGETTQSIFVSTSDTLSVVQDVAGCLSDPSNEIIVEITPPPVITAMGPTSFCIGDNVTLSSDVATGITWTTTETDQDIVVSNAGNYSVTLDVTGCPSLTSNIITTSILSTPPQPTITASGPTTFCQGDSVVLTSSSPTGNLWSTGGTDQQIVVHSSANITVQVSNGTCTSPASAATVVTVNPIPTQPSITADGATTFCSGDSLLLISSETANNVWSSGETNDSIYVFASGTYELHGSASGCNSDTSGVVITVNTTPPTPTISTSGPATICSGANVTMTSSSPTGNIWSTGQTIQSISVGTAGNYSVHVVDNGCSSDTTFINIDVNTIPPQPTITADGPTTFCSGDSLLLISSGTTNNVWSTTETNDSIYVFTAGTYTLHASNNGCNSDTSDIVITVNSTPAAPTISASGPTDFCIGESVDLTSSSPTGNIWSTGATAQTITVNSSNNYSLHVMDMGCSSDTVFMNVTVNSIPTQPTITADGSTTFCSGDSLLLISSETTNNVWFTGETNDSIYVLTAGTYTLHASNNGCNSDTSEIIVSTNPAPPTPTILEGTSASFCQGQTLTLNSNSAVDNVWSTAANTQSINVTSPGTYSLTLINGFGCESPSSASIVVSEIPLPPAPTITADGPTTFCVGGSVSLTSSSLINNVWSNSLSGSTINVTNSGTYSVQYTNANGCYSPPSNEIIVTVVTTPAPPVITASGPTSFCPGGSVDLSTDYTSGIEWSNAQTDQTITVNSTQTLSATYNDGNGCQSLPSNDITVTVYPAPPTPVITPSGSVDFCTGGSVNLTTSIPTGVLWSTGPTTSTISVTASDVITVSHTDVNGCQSTSAPITVSVNAPPAAPIITAIGGVEICQGDSLLIESDSPNTYWSTTQLANSIYVDQAINVSAVALNGGCPSSSSNTISVLVNPVPPPVNIIVDGSLSFCEGDSVKLISSAVSNFEWSNQLTDQILIVDTSGLFSISTTNQFNCVTYSDTVEVIAHPFPTLTVNDYPVIMCPNWNATLLNTGSPAGGTYTGEAVDTAGYFHPEVGAGIYQFWYTYTSPEGCTSIDSAYVTVDGCVGVDEHDLTQIKLYPNPTLGEFTVDAGDFSVKSIKIQNVQGQLIRTFEMNSVSVYTDYLDLPNGVYYVNIETEESDTSLVLPLTIVN